MANMEINAVADRLISKGLELADLAGGVQYCLARGEEAEILVRLMLERVDSINRLAGLFHQVVRSQNG